MTGARQLLILIADISGYTKLLLRHGKALAHGQMVISELLRSLLDQVQPPFAVSRLEGDAVIVYAPLDEPEAGLSRGGSRPDHPLARRFSRDAGRSDPQYHMPLRRLCQRRRSRPEGRRSFRGDSHPRRRPFHRTARRRRYRRSPSAEEQRRCRWLRVALRRCLRIRRLLDELGGEDPFELAPALVELGYNREAIQTLDDDTVADVETQTRALARGFGRHKGLEYAALHRLGDARPVIGDRHYHAAVLLRGDIEVFSEPGRTCFEVRLPIHGSTDQDEGSAMTAIHRPDDDELRRILPVNPNLNEVLGEPAHAELNAITEPIDSVVIFRRAEFVPDIVSAAIDQGVKVIWMQDGIRSPASRRARPARGPSGGYGRLYARQLEPPVGEE